MRQWWRPWQGIAPTGSIQPERKPDKIKWVGIPAAPVRTPRVQSITYPAGFATVGEKRAQRQRQRQ